MSAQSPPICGLAESANRLWLTPHPHESSTFLISPFKFRSISYVSHTPHPNTMPPDRQPRVQRIVRVRTGCWSCRRRKKKCDELRPICSGCRRNDLRCEWPSTVPGMRDSGPENDRSSYTPADRRSSYTGSIEDLDAMLLPGSPLSRRHSSPLSTAGLSAIMEEQMGQASDPDETIDRRRSTLGEEENALVASMAVGNVVPRTMSMLPGYDPESYALLSHYLSNTADVMANGTTPINPFLVQIVPLAFTSDLLLQLVIAQSAAHRAFRRRDDSDAVANSHYTKAIQLFRHGVNDFIEGKESNPLMLLIGALLMCFTEVGRTD